MPKRIWSACLALLATGAWAHAHLEAAQPAVDSKNADVRQIRLVFSEPVEPKFSTIRLESGEERAVVEPAAEVEAADPKVLVVHLFEKLPPGAYKVRWAVVTVDGHRVSGTYSFIASP